MTSVVTYYLYIIPTPATTFLSSSFLQFHSIVLKTVKPYTTFVINVLNALPHYKRSFKCSRTLPHKSLFQSVRLNATTLCLT
jgi:hypothetical protein